MPDLVLQLLKFLFLIVLYIFIAQAVRAVYMELRPSSAPPMSASSLRPSSARGRKAPGRATVIEGEKLKGKSFDLGDELMIGRDTKCHVALDDSYVSQVHARIFSKGEGHVVEDMGSTNGTYVNRQRIGAPTELRTGDQVKIGRTVFEMRK